MTEPEAQMFVDRHFSNSDNRSELLLKTLVVQVAALTDAVKALNPPVKPWKNAYEPPKPTKAGE